MGFISFQFVAFLALLLPVYYRLGRRGQNLLLLAASLAFSAAWDVRDVVLLVGSTCVDFAICRGLAWENQPGSRKRALWMSVLWNVGMLAGFKQRWWIEAALGFAPLRAQHVHLWAPIGLSFYALQRLTYALDAYFRVLRPSAGLLDFALFSSFFPLTISGPIERARNVLPQFAVRRDFDLARFYEGCWLFGLGLWKKVYVADHMALGVKKLLTDGATGTETLLGLYAYAFQIYADFAGYSDMARGTARLLGIDVMQNFELPYFSTSLVGYWQRWHVSLTSFLDDYIYKPTTMALRAWPTAGVIIAMFVTFAASALWHGTGWTFIVWGALHAFGLCVYAFTRKWRKRLKKRLPSGVLAALGGTLTFHYVLLGYTFFRARSVSAAASTLMRLGSGPLLHGHNLQWAGEFVLYAGMLLTVDVLQRRSANPFWVLNTRPLARVLCYAVLIVCTLRFYAPGEEFIYADF